MQAHELKIPLTWRKKNDAGSLHIPIREWRVMVDAGIARFGTECILVIPPSRSDWIILPSYVEDYPQQPQGRDDVGQVSN